MTSSRLRLSLALAAACAAVIVGAISLLAIYSRATRTGLPDDMFIVLVYARHLLDTGTFYWNASDGTLDGFTSLLDVLVKAVLFAISGPSVLYAVSLSALAFHVTAPIVAAFAVVSRLWSWRALACATLTGLVVGTDKALTDGSSMLLETGLFVGLVTSVVLLVPLDGTRWNLRTWVLAGLLVALPLARPEGLFLSPVVLAGLFYESRRDRAAQHRNVLLAVLVLGSIGSCVLWHLWTFGYWAPNTYYAKTSDSRLREIRDGVVYVLTYLRYPPGALKIAALVFIPILAYRQEWTRPEQRVRFHQAVAIAVVALGLTVLAGGDSYRLGSRFLALPAALAAVALGLATVGLRSTRRWLGAGLLGTMAVLQTPNVVSSWPDNAGALASRPRALDDVAACEARMADNLWRRYPNATIGQSDFQRLKYYLDGARVIDLHGLNDRAIAHRKTTSQVLGGKLDMDRSMDLPLDIMIVGLSYTSDERLEGLSPASVLDHSSWPMTDATKELITQRYKVATVTGCDSAPSRSGRPTRYLNFLVRKDL
jgi:hypothetical protein